MSNFNAAPKTVLEVLSPDWISVSFLWLAMHSLHESCRVFLDSALMFQPLLPCGFRKSTSPTALIFSFLLPCPEPSVGCCFSSGKDLGMRREIFLYHHAFISLPSCLFAFKEFSSTLARTFCTFALLQCLMLLASFYLVHNDSCYSCGVSLLNDIFQMHLVICEIVHVLLQPVSKETHTHTF